MTEPLAARIDKLRELHADLDSCRKGGWSYHQTFRNNALAIIDELVAENERLRKDLEWYKVEAVAQTNTDARTKL